MTIIEFDFGKTWTLPLFEPLPLAQWLQFGKKTLEKSSTISRIISQSEYLYWNITLWLIITKNNNKNQNEEPFNKTEVCTMLLNICLWSKRLCEKNQSSKQKKTKKKLEEISIKKVHKSIWLRKRTHYLTRIYFCVYSVSVITVTKLFVLSLANEHFRVVQTHYTEFIKCKLTG